MKEVLGQMRRFILYAGDLVVLYLVLAVTLAIRYPQSFGQYVWSLHFWPFTILFAVWIVVFYISGLYDPHLARNNINFYLLVFRSIIANALVAVVYFYVFSSRLFSIKPQVVFLIYILIFAVIFLFWRRLYNHLTESEIFTKNVLCVGDGEDMLDLIKELKSKPYLGYNIIDHITSDRLKNNFDLKFIFNNKKIDTVVTSFELVSYPQIVSQFYKNLFLGVKYFDLATFYEKLTGRIPVAAIGQLWFLENISENEKKFYETVKRVLEILLTAIFGIIGLIMAPFIAFSIKVSSEGPVLFVQTRIGKNGKPFQAIKFRTMITGSEKLGPQWTKIGDPRITTLGKFLRKTKLDEIPQLINILKGEMSFIGPRPEQPEFVGELTKKIPYYNERHLIKPGLTGWAQIHFPQSGASAEDSLIKLQCDLFYIKNRSLLLDLGIILKTINIILSGKGR